MTTRRRHSQDRIFVGDLLSFSRVPDSRLPNLRSMRRKVNTRIYRRSLERLHLAMRKFQGQGSRRFFFLAMLTIAGRENASDECRFRSVIPSKLSFDLFCLCASAPKSYFFQAKVRICTCKLWMTFLPTLSEGAEGYFRCYRLTERETCTWSNL